MYNAFNCGLYVNSLTTCSAKDVWIVYVMEYLVPILDEGLVQSA